jgi:hypothetical protein
MPLSDVHRAWQGGLASIVIGLGHGGPSLDHLGPHNAIEWAMYLGLFALVVAVGWRVAHNRDDTLPVVHKPRPGKARPDQAPRRAVGSAALGSDGLDDQDPGS